MRGRGKRVSPVADLKQPWNNLMRHDSEICGAIELAWERGFAAGSAWHAPIGEAVRRPRRKGAGAVRLNSSAKRATP